MLHKITYSIFARKSAFHLYSAQFMNPKNFLHTRALNFAANNNIQPGQKLVGKWLFTCSGMVFGAVVLGGLTRLTESGLSMTDWHLLGKRPPVSEEQWQKEFEQYKNYPEYKMKNVNMSLNEFKFIFWMEYFHRQWGRAIGTVFLLPASYFWYKGYFTSAMKKRVVGMGGLIMLQGLMGWYMVKSGLEKERFEEPSDIPRVSQYRLMTHLGLAFVLYTLLLWNGLASVFPPPQPSNITKSLVSLRKFAHATKGWIFITALSGALVAGLDAGLVYNSFPKMADRWIPTDLLTLHPSLKNFTENPTTVQFDHRIMGTTTLVLTSLLFWRAMKITSPHRVRLASGALAGMAWFQVGLGISTLLMYVPTWLAAMHQSGSLVTLSFAVWLTHELKHFKRIAK